jgi:hypothetical protein
MNFKTHNEIDVNSNGTSGVGSINAEYSKLKKVFGQPTLSDGYKSDAEWEIEFENGMTACIYNWKDGKNYKGSKGIPKTKITDWHVGGNDSSVVELIESLLK